MKPQTKSDLPPKKDQDQTSEPDKAQDQDQTSEPDKAQDQDQTSEPDDLGDLDDDDLLALFDAARDADEQSKRGEELDPKEFSKNRTFEVNGEQVTLEELQKGYLRQSDYTKKTQEIAQRRKELEAWQKSLKDSGVLDALQKAAGADVGELDPLDPDSVMKTIEKNVADKLVQLMAPQMEALERQSAASQIKAFMAEHPEFKDEKFKKSVGAIMLKRDTLTIEDAYLMAKGRLATATEQETRKKKAAARDAAKAQGGGGLLGQKLGPPDEVIEGGPGAIFKWLEDHPDVDLG